MKVVKRVFCGLLIAGMMLSVMPFALAEDVTLSQKSDAAANATQLYAAVYEQGQLKAIYPAEKDDGVVSVTIPAEKYGDGVTVKVFLLDADCKPVGSVVTDLVQDKLNPGENEMPIC